MNYYDLVLLIYSGIFDKSHPFYLFLDNPQIRVLLIVILESDVDKQYIYLLLYNQ